jgi:hypothetical protein
MPRIFISYRRDDSAGYVGRLYDKISERFGEESVFMDVDAIQPGQDFVAVIEKAVSSCDVLLAVIGKQWMTITDDHGYRRIDNPNDFVRLEIAAALRRKNVVVIPVLVRDAMMPSAAYLPADLQPLARRNAHVVSDRNFHRDVDDLIEILRKATRRRLPLRLLLILLVLLGLLAGGYLLGTTLLEDGSLGEQDAETMETDTPTPAPQSSEIQPTSGLWEITFRFDPNDACGDRKGQVEEAEESFRFVIIQDGDLLIRRVGEEGPPEEFWRVEPNIYLQGEYDGFFIQLEVVAPDHMEEVFSHPPEAFGVPPENVPDDPFCRGTISYFLK